MRKLQFILIFFISFSVASAQDVKVTAAFDTSRIYIGDQIGFTIKIDQPSGIGLQIPVFKDTLCKKIEIIAGPAIDSISGSDGRILIIEKYLITSFDSGFYELPPVFAEMKNETGLKRFYSDYTRLEVMRPDVAPADTTAVIYDIIKPYRAPVTAGEIIPWILLAIVTGLIIWFIIRLIKKYKKSKPDYVPVVVPDPAHIIALRELERLKDEELWQKGEIKLYYTRLTEILRQYLENRYSVYSLELTTSETLTALVKTGFKKDESYNKLKSVLTGADLVKFAKYTPEAAENELNYQSALDFIMSTKEADKTVVNEAEVKKGGEVQ